ncbi:hypothetical protein tb265_21930 [Gemmatimonadetes bacterium T265]|nr:hypothetical protein tb265_21930 [Gemmatimonadetes bacterium T265]
MFSLTDRVCAAPTAERGSAEERMDILVLLADGDDGVGAMAGDGLPIAHVRSSPDPRAYNVGFGRGAREVVTLYGAAEADCLAVAIAAAVEGRRTEGTPPDAVRQLGVWADRGAVGDVAWRDRATGNVVTQDVAISAAAIAGTAGRVLREHGRAIRQTIAGLVMPDWPEGTRRAIHVTLRHFGDLAAVSGPSDALLASFREADGYDDLHDEMAD